MNQMYERLSRVPFLSKSYTFKFLFIAFLGIHIPLIGLIVFVLFRPDGVNAFAVLMLTLGLTLGATALTLAIMNGLLSPLRKSRQALDDYIQKRQLPQLPVHFRDEAGILMQNIQYTVTELNDLLEEKKDLTALLSHDLRAPLYNVKTLSEFLLQETDPASAKELVGMILESTQEQASLLENILHLLRQDHMLTSENSRRPVSTLQVVDETLALFTTQAKEKGIRLKKRIAYNGTIEVQPELFGQVLKNLMSNAIKFSYSGSEVQVSVQKKGEKTLIEVADAGMGFEPQAGERLFDRFTKNGRSGTAGEASTGMGLYLSRKIIKQHKGDLLASSAGPGRGATFTISLYQ